MLAGLPVLVQVAHVPVLAAQAALLCAQPLINYQVLRLWAFHVRPPTPTYPDTDGQPVPPALTGGTPG